MTRRASRTRSECRRQDRTSYELTTAATLKPRKDIQRGAAELMDAVTHHGVHIAINQRWPLREVAEAHSALEAARTTGSTILLPFE